MLSTNIKFFDVYKEVKIGKQTVKIPKFSLGQLIEFSLHYRAIEFTIIAKGKPDYSDVFKLMGIKGVFNDDEKHEIMIQAKDYNIYETKESKTDAQFDEWVAGVIVTFGIAFGWTQNETLGLKPDTITELLKQLHRQQSIKRLETYLDMQMAVSITIPVKKRTSFRLNRRGELYNMLRNACGIEETAKENKFDEVAFNALKERQRQCQ
jgi:hypothetical protein